MSFSKALNFPFANNNLNKILQIGLVFGLILAVQVIFGPIGALISMVGNLLFGLFISGYGIFVMQNIMRGEETLPEFEIGDSIGRGVKIFFASLVYLVPLFIIIAVIVIMTLVITGPIIGEVFSEIITGLENPGYTPDMSSSSNDAGAMLPLLMCGALLVFIPLTIIMSYAIQVGMARFAAEDRSGALFEFGTNIKIVTSNGGKIFALFLNQLGIGIIYLIVGAILGFVSLLFVGVSVGVASSASSDLGIFAIIFLVIFQIVVSILNTCQQMSNLHLIAGFGVEVGLVKGKKKTDGSLDMEYDF